jgi:exopolysaccharide production protein ExoY
MSNQLKELERTQGIRRPIEVRVPSAHSATAVPRGEKVIPTGFDDLPPGRVEDIPRLMERASVLARTVEIVCACFGLVIASPIMLVIAILIKRESPGPIFFKQKRLGLNGEYITLIKFRTFYADAKERFPEMYNYSFSDDEIKDFFFKTDNDPRITPMGVWLRKTSLDELPNIWNMLRGDIALVGPRPQIPELLPYYRGDLLKRFSVRPGLTDLAHCSGRSDLSFLHTCMLDQEYVERRSIKFDLIILWKTFVMVVRRDGAY